jgi:NAD(P)-dependent dehydrogenase (short-subunit alcohol dehydrogenase family)
LSKEVYKNGITCNVISPSAVKSDLMDTLNEDLLNEILKRNAIHNVGSTDDIINIINWLIKDSSFSITGQNIYLGGV